MRLFIAIDLPLELKKALVKLRRDLPGARWVPTAQIHLTLAFLGEVEEARVEQLRAELARIHRPPFPLTLTGMGCFPSWQQPRVLWVGLLSQPQLLALVAAVQNALRACDLPQDERPFSAHITLARLKRPVGREVAEFLAQPLPDPLPSLPVREFILFQSRLTPHGAEHLPLSSFSLTPG